MIPKSSLYFQLIHKIPRSRPEQIEGTNSNYGKKDEILRSLTLTQNDNIRRGLFPFTYAQGQDDKIKGGRDSSPLAQNDRKKLRRCPELKP